MCQGDMGKTKFLPGWLYPRQVVITWNNLMYIMYNTVTLVLVVKLLSLLKLAICGHWTKRGEGRKFEKVW